MTALVGLDVGTTGVKAIALSADGNVLATATRVYELSTPRAGWAEQDPEDWWRASEAALAEVSAGRDVAGIGLSGQMHGLVVQNPMNMGYLGVLRMVDHLKGRPVEPRIDTGVWMITKENMKQPETAELLHPPVDQYLK